MESHGERGPEVKTVLAVDLFCGAGGTSSGLVAACQDLRARLDLLAINHWSVAIATHERNLPGVRHLCSAVEAVSPTAAVKGRRLDLLVASPECKHFSTARGGRPINDQKRADPWQVVRWAAELRVENLLIENVPEFRSWGPLDARGRPMKSRRGQTYQAYLAALRGLGYQVDDRVLNAADYGDPTTRRRLFILARRGRPVRWPEPTHARAGSLLPGQAPWRAAREIIDWSIPGSSIFGRKRPLSRNTMERIIAGLQRFGGPELGPFLVVLRGTDSYHLQKSAKPLELPLPSVCASTSHFALAEPFLLGQHSGSIARSVGDPVPTVAADGAIALVEPFILPPLGVHHRNGKANKARSLDEPVQTITSRGGGHIVQPFIVGAGGPQRQGQPASVDEPLGTALTRNHRALIQPFLVPHYGERPGQAPRTHSVDEPLPTVPASTQHALVQPFIVHVNHGENPKGSGRGNGGRIRSTSDPLPTVTAGQRGMALIEALIAKYYGTGIAKPVTEPLDTVTTKDRFGLVTFEQAHAGLALDIRFRMLKPHELAGAQGFTSDYVFSGTIEEQVRQIGNAVPRRLARALCLALLA